MSTIAEVELRADEFALNHTLEAHPDAEFEAERVVAHDAEQVMPYLWVREADHEDVAATLDDDPSVRDLESLADLGEEHLFRMAWVEDIRTLVEILVEQEAAIRNAVSHDGQWSLTILFPEREALSRAYDFCEENGLSLEITRLYDVDDGDIGRYGLTEGQHDALIAAIEAGYYDIPRETDQSTLADELDISHQALSERLRRAQRSLITHALVMEPEG